MDETLSARRGRYAAQIAERARRWGFDDPRVEEAFASVPRESCLAPPPWRIFAPGGLFQETTSDPSSLYDDVLVVLDRRQGINNGQPSLHAAWMMAISPQPGETVVQVGAGSGYYTAILSWLVRPGGCVHAYEIEPQLAELLRGNLSDDPQVTVHPVSGVDEIPPADVVHASAGAAAPPSSWLRALRPGGRLVFPWQPGTGGGTTLVVRRTTSGFSARCLFSVAFICMVGAGPREVRTRGFPKRSFDETRSIRFIADEAPDETATGIYDEVWLSSREP